MKNYSKQREEVLNLLKNVYSHPTAQEIYLMLKAQGSTLSKSTVYRNLSIMTQNRIIIKISMQDGPDRYDYIHNEHNHIICVKCGRVADFNNSFKTEQVIELIEQQTGFKTPLNSVTIQGICSKCRINIS